MAVKFQQRSKSAESLADYRAGLAVALKSLPTPLLVHGDNEYLRLEAATAVKTAWQEKHPAGEAVALRAGDVQPLSHADVMAELSATGMFAREKLVIVRQADRLLFPRSAAAQGDAPAKAGPQSEGRLLDMAESPAKGIWLLLETSQLPKNRNAGKRLAAWAARIPCPELRPNELPGWLDETAGKLGKRLSREAAGLLVQAHGNNLSLLASELEKLSLFAAGRDEIDIDTVREFMTGTVEFDIFGLTNAVEERDVARAVSFARRITAQGARDQSGKRKDGRSSSHQALALLAASASNLLAAGVARAEGKGAADLASEVGASPWRAEKLLAAARLYSLPELRRMASLMAEQLKATHDTGGDAQLALETLAVRLAGGA